MVDLLAAKVTVEGGAKSVLVVLVAVKVSPGTASPGTAEKVHGSLTVLEYDREEGQDSDVDHTETKAFKLGFGAWVEEGWASKCKVDVGEVTE